ncbi:MAG: hypothetical protein HY208_06380 [Nitrospirae bacterium]|nr:hypothetical protein [Nitrospirota bacterium]
MQARRVWWIAVYGACLMVLGCSALDALRRPSPAGVQREAPAAPNGSDMQSVLEYYRGLEALSEEGLQQEFARAQQAMSERHQSADRIRLAVLFGLPRATFRNYDRAVELLNDEAGDPAGRDAASKDFLLFLSAVMQELKKQSEQYQKLDLKFKEERKQRELLQQKLEELTTIEKNLLEQGASKKP